ncbi:MAG TPA: hypothetical protein VFW84_04570 [Aquabacterium sp.]|uniref:hypothetical protein n=1 Tax=Aquabacterium sp. TaxID=1872578 RepID=UPI002E316582|nr:hypothetical protein [Aquabacterium sp.]HEX5371986.1 hypothetical protein [Aquabacterium sp.]
MINNRLKWIGLWLVFSMAMLCAVTACHSKPPGPGMILKFGSVIEGKRVYVKSSKTTNGQPFSNPGSVGGVGTSKWGSWRHIPAAVEAASGDGRDLPEWVEFVWQELEYPGLQPADFPSDEAYRKHVREEFSSALIKTQRLEIKSRVPQDVVDEVIESKRHASRGSVAEKSFWVFIFWTPEGIKMRWQLRYDPGLKQRNFGDVVREGGDDLDQYNR